MSLLLDTHYVYALSGAPGTLSKKEKLFLADETQRLRVSAVSVWELRLKWNALFASGSRKGPIEPAQALQLLIAQSLDFLPMTAAHAATRLSTPIGHNDPFDELLIAQAQVEGLKLLTRDKVLRSHPLSVSVE